MAFLSIVGAYLLIPIIGLKLMIRAKLVEPIEFDHGGTPPFSVFVIFWPICLIVWITEKAEKWVSKK